MFDAVHSSNFSCLDSLFFIECLLDLFLIVIYIDFRLILEVWKRQTILPKRLKV